MFIKKIIILLVAIIPLLLIESCSETPTNIGSGLLDQDQINVKSFDSSVDTVQVTSSYFKRTISLGTSSRIMLGRKDNIEAGILIRFSYTLADTLASQILSDSVLVEDSWVDMQPNYDYGHETDPLAINVYKINSSWTTVGFNADSISSLQYDNTEQSTEYFISDTLTRINLQPPLVTSWLKAAADTAVAADNGIYIRPTDNSGRITGYYALGSSSELIPILYVVYQKMDGDLDTLSYTPLADLGYISGVLPTVDTTNIVVQAGLEAVSKVSFDLSKIPFNAIINKAKIVLTVDSSQTVVGDNYTNSLVAYFMIDTLSIDSLTSSVLLNPQGNTFSGDITFFVQEWIRDQNNQGLLITSAGRYSGVELFALKGANADVSVRPRIIVTYTVKQ